MGSSRNPTPAAMPAADAAVALAAQTNHGYKQEPSGTAATASGKEADREMGSPGRNAANAVATAAGAAAGATGSTSVASNVSSREASRAAVEAPLALPGPANAAANAVDGGAAGSISELQLVQRADASGVLGYPGSPSTFDAQYCINLPLENKAQLSRAIIADTLAAMPVPPQTVSNVQGPVLEVHQVDDHSVDVRIVHSFTANFDDSLEHVYQRAVAAKQAAARQQRQATLHRHQPQHYAAAAAGHGQGDRTGSQQHVQFCVSDAGDSTDAHQHHKHHMHRHHHRRQLSKGEEDQGCTCTELQDEDEQLLPQGIKWSNRCVVHEQDPASTDTEDAASHSAATNSIDDAGVGSVSNSQPSSRDSMLAAPAVAVAAASRAAPSQASGASATPFGASRFHARGVEQCGVAGDKLQPAQQQQQQQQFGVADTAVAAHGGRRLSIEVLRAVAGSKAAPGASGQFGAAAIVAPSAIDTVDETSSEGSCAPGVYDDTRHRHQPHKEHPGHVAGRQGWWAEPSSSSSECSNFSTRSGSPAGGRSLADGIAAVLPGPAVTPNLRHHTPVLVTMQGRHTTAHGHQEVDVAPLHDLDPQHRQLPEEQQQEEQQAQPTAVHLHHGGTDASNPMDLHILHQPEGFVPLSGTTAGPAAAAAAAAAGGQQHASEEAVLHNWTSNALGGTLIMPRQQHQRHRQLGLPEIAAVGALPGVVHPRVEPRVFVPRCEWELDPRKVLVGRRLAVGGFAEVFLGKYEGTVVAIKRLLTNDAATIERFVSEVRMLARLRHPNLILFMGYCTLPELCIVSEYMSKGSLYSVLHSPEQRKQRAAAARKQLGHAQHDAAPADAHQCSTGSGSSSNALEAPGIVPIGSLSAELQLSPAEEKQRQLEGLEPKLQRLVAVAVARGMAYLHTRTPPILHLDLKSPNILVDDRWRVKITDFGLSRARQRTFVSSSAQGGTPEWMAPEVLRCESVAEPADVYSYGVVLWELITGRAPWENYNPMQVVAMVGFRDLALPMPRTAAEPFLLELCKRCMQRNPAARPSFPQIAVLLDQQYGPPSWAAHAQPLLPPTPRPALLGVVVTAGAGNVPALPAPATRAAAAEATPAIDDAEALQLQQVKQQVQVQPVRQLASAAPAAVAGCASAVASPFAGNMAPWSLESAQSLHAQAGGNAAQPGDAPAAGPAQSPFAGNLAPWSVESVQHLPETPAANAGDTSAVAAAPLAASPVLSPFAGNLAPWSIESVQELHQASAAAAAPAASPFAGNTAPWSVDSVNGLQDTTTSVVAAPAAAAPAKGPAEGPAASPFAGNLAPWSVESMQGLQSNTAAAPPAAAPGAVFGPSLYYVHAGNAAQCSLKPAAAAGPVSSPFAGHTAPWSVESAQSFRQSAEAEETSAAAAVLGPVSSPFAGNTTPWSMESLQSFRQSAETGAATAAAAAPVAGPVPSPLAGNTAPWSVESVQSLHGAAGHLAAADLHSSSTGSSSSEAAPAPVSGCSSTAFAAAAAEQQGVAAAAEQCAQVASQPPSGKGSNAALTPAAEGSNQRTEGTMYPVVDDTTAVRPVFSSTVTAASAAAAAAFGSPCASLAPAIEVGPQRAEPAAAAAVPSTPAPAAVPVSSATALTADEAAAAVPCADSPTAPFHFKPGQECQATPLKVGTMQPGVLATGSSAIPQQQRQASSILAVAHGPTHQAPAVNHNRSGGLSGPLSSSSRGETLSMPLHDDTASLACPGPAVGCTTATGVAAAAAAVPDAWVHMLEPHMPACIRAAAAAAGPRGHGGSSNAVADAGQGDHVQDGPASAPAGSVQHNVAAAAAYQAAVERERLDEAAGSTAGLSSQIPSEGSFLHSLWPSMTTLGSFASLASRQASQSSRQANHVHRRGTRSSAGDSSSSGDEGRAGVRGDSEAGNAVADIGTTTEGKDLRLQKQQQQQQQQPDWCFPPVRLRGRVIDPVTPPSVAVNSTASEVATEAAACNDCSRSSSPDTTRQQQQQQQSDVQQQQQLPVYQVWPVLLSHSAASCVDPAGLPLLLKKASPPEEDASKKDKKPLSGRFEAKGTAAAAEAVAEAGCAAFHDAAAEQQQSPRSAVVAAGVEQLLLRPGSPASPGRLGSPVHDDSNLAAGAGNDVDTDTDAATRSGGSTQCSRGSGAGGAVGFAHRAAHPGSREVPCSATPTTASLSHLSPREARRDQALLASPRSQQQQQQVVHELPLQPVHIQHPSMHLQQLSQQQQEMYQHVEQQQAGQQLPQQHVREAPEPLVAVPKRLLPSHSSARCHSFDASVLKQAVQHCSQQQQVSSCQKKGRFIVSTTSAVMSGSMLASERGEAAAAVGGGEIAPQGLARQPSQLSPRGQSGTTPAAAALQPVQVPGKPFKQAAGALHGSMGDLAGEAALHGGSGKGFWQQQLPVVALAPTAPQSLPPDFLQQQQQQRVLHEITMPAVSSSASPDLLAAAAASAAATSCADASLGLMSAVEQPPGQLLLSGLSGDLPLPSASSAAQISETLHMADPAATGAAIEQVHRQQEQSLQPPAEWPMMLTGSTSTGQGPDLQQGSGDGASPARSLAPKGFWGSGVARDRAADNSIEAVGHGSSLVAVHDGKLHQQQQQQGAVSPMQQQPQSRRPRGVSSPGAVMCSAYSARSRDCISELGTSSSVGSSNSKSCLPSHPAMNQLLQMHFSTGGLSSGGVCYKSGRFSVTVEQQLQVQGSSKALKASSSAGTLVVPAAPPCSSVVQGQDRLQPQQQHGLLHASASCGSLPVLLRQQQQVAAASSSQIASLEDSSDHAGDTMLQVLPTAVPAEGASMAASMGGECTSYWSSADPSLAPSLTASNRPSDAATDGSSSIHAPGAAAVDVAAAAAGRSAVQLGAAGLGCVSDSQGDVSLVLPFLPAAVQHTELQQMWGTVAATSTIALGPAAAATTARGGESVVAGLDAAAPASDAQHGLPRQCETPLLLSLAHGLGPGDLDVVDRLPPEPQAAAQPYPSEGFAVAAMHPLSPQGRASEVLAGQRGSPLSEQQQQQQGSSPPLHQRRLLAHPPAHLTVPGTAATGSVAVVQSAVPLPLQQQQQQQHGAVLLEGRVSETGRISASSLGTVPPVSRTTSTASTASGLSPRSVSGCGKPPLVPQHCKTLSPNATPCPSPRPRAMSRDYCRGRFQVHESPLVGPLQSWKSGGGSTGGTNAPYPTPVATPTAAAATSTPTAAMMAVPTVHGVQAASSVSAASMIPQQAEGSSMGAAAVFAAHLQQEQAQQQPVLDASAAVAPGSPEHQVSWAGAVASCASPPASVPHSARAALSSASRRVSAANSSSSSPLLLGKPAAAALQAGAAAPDTSAAFAAAPTAAASAPAAVDTDATATAGAAVGSQMAKSLSCVKLGRFLVTHESGSTGSTRASRAGSTASSTHASRAGSPRWEHPPLPSKLGSSKNLAAAAAAAAGSDRSGVSVLMQPAARRIADTHQQLLPQTCKDAAAAPAGTPAAALHPAQGAAVVGAVSMHPAVSAALSDLSSISASTVGTAAPAAAAAAAPHDAPASTVSAPQLAPIKTVSKRGRFVVTQVTPASTACSTPKSGLLGPTGVSARMNFTADAAATPTASPADHSAVAAAGLHAAGGGDRAALNAAAAAAAAAWLEAAAASTAAAAVGSTAAAGSTAAEALVLTCPVCDTPHALPCQAVQPSSALLLATPSSARQLFPDAVLSGDGKQQSTASAPDVAEGNSSTVAALAAMTAVPDGGANTAAAAISSGQLPARSLFLPKSPVVGRSKSSTNITGLSPPRPVVCYSSAHTHSFSVGSSLCAQAAAGGASPATAPNRSVSPMLHICSSCGAPLPPLPVVGADADLAMTQATALAPASATAGGGGPPTAAEVPGLTAAPVVSLGSATESGATLATVQDAVPAVHAGSTLGGPAPTALVPQGLLAAAAARVLAARQQIQQEGSVAGSDVSSQVSYASCCLQQPAQQQALGNQIQLYQQQQYSRRSSFTAAGCDCAVLQSGRSSIGCLQADGGHNESARTAAASVPAVAGGVVELASVPATGAAAGDVVAAEQVTHLAPAAVLLAALQLPVSHPLQCFASPGSDTALSDCCSCSSPPCSAADSSNGSHSGTRAVPAPPHGELLQPQPLPEELPAPAGLVLAAPTTAPHLGQHAADAACLS